MRYGAFCATCGINFNITPAHKNEHMGMAQNHSREQEHYCIVYSLVSTDTKSPDEAEAEFDIVARFHCGKQIK
ncbi:MAG: hypothetical protein OXI43_13540 [Candidatus Poribacteria bacterium]|nr:hypothetical protein [Candidatus Poribacteria bacterium]